MLATKKSRRSGAVNTERLASESVWEGNRPEKSFVPIKKVFLFAQMDEEREKKKELCNHCDEKWNPPHVCKNPKVYLLQEKNCEVEDLVVRHESE